MSLDTQGRITYSFGSKNGLLITYAHRRLRRS